MTTGMRIRIFVLQVGLIGIFAFAAVIALGAGNFVQGQIHDELVSQKITFPAAGSAALPASEMPDLQQYGGQAVDNGPKAQAYANGFIGRHLKNIAGGKTYAEFPANGLTTAQAAQKASLFQGETLRGLLLNAYGWWTVGQYAIYAGYGMAIAAAAVLVALLVEIGLMVRARDVATSKVTATTPQLARQS